MLPRACKIAREDRIGLNRLQGPVRQRGNVVVLVFVVAPALPILLRRTDRGISRLGAVHRHQKLREVKQLRNVVFVLIADQLASRFLQALGRALVFDHQEGDAVYISDDVATLRLCAGRPLDRHFGGDVKNVVGRCIPVDEAE